MRREASDENTLEAEGLPQGPQWGLRGGGGTPGSHSEEWGEVEGPPRISQWRVGGGGRGGTLRISQWVVKGDRGRGP